MKKRLLLFTFLLGLFSFLTFVEAQTIVNITDSEVTVTSYTNSEVIINGKSDLHLTSSTAPLSSSTVKLNSTDSWLFFDNIRPSVVLSSWLQYVYINDVAAANGTNCRVAIYKQGTVVMPYSSSLKPLTVYSGENFTGDSASYSLHTFYKSLGALDNKIASFKLKRGYMATLANGSDGMGYSRVFIADNEDLEYADMPELLDSTISFIRVLSWEYASKKGWGGSDFTQYSQLNATWRYDWSASGSTTSHVEYVPIKQNGGWPSWTEINDKQYVSHVLGYNEPDRPDQSYISMADMLASWPNMMKTGLRIGSPAWSSPWSKAGEAADGNLFDFLNKCDELNYRVDFVALHCYWGGKSASSWYNDLKYLHEATGRPLWITEWNNGANWTTETWPDADRSYTTANATKQLNDITAILQVLDTASFIERYSIYNWVQDCRAMALNSSLTLAGEYYANDKAPMAFNRSKEIIPTFTYKDPSLSAAYSDNQIILTINDPNGDFYNGYIVERSTDNGDFSIQKNEDSPDVTTYTEAVDRNFYSVRYKAKSKYKNGNTSNYTKEQGYDVARGGDSILYGKLSFSNVDWNTVYHKKTLSSPLPIIVLGAATYQNTTVLFSPQLKQQSFSRFSVKLAPWDYQDVTTLSKEEGIPYLIAIKGSYNLGGLKALAGQQATVGQNWVTVTFSAPFETVPVVFAQHLMSTTTYPTVVRVRNVTTTGFEVKLQKEAAISTTLSTQTIAYFAIEQGIGEVLGGTVIVGKTADNAVGSTNTKVNYGGTFTDPVFIPQMQTCNDDITAVVRNVYSGLEYSYIKKEREASTSTASTASETVGWIVLDGAVTGVQPPTYKQLSFYPNPVVDYINLNQNYSESYFVDIYNLLGVMVKRVEVTGTQIDVRDLPAGSYIIRTAKLGSNKFIKL